MHRRKALKSLTLAAGGLISLPAWASGWTPASVGKPGNVSAGEEALLAELVETFIPQTDTPGAKALQVHRFLARMVRDCYDPAAQTLLSQGLARTDERARQAFGRDFIACDTRQRTDLLRSFATDAELKPFCDLVKNLTVRGYTNSEYYLVNVQKYVMAPGFYHGCVTVPAQALTEKK